MLTTEVQSLRAEHNFAPDIALYQNQPAVTDGDVITANSTAPLDFAYHIFKKLELYSAQVLEAWYGWFKTGDPAYFATLQKLTA